VQRRRAEYVAVASGYLDSRKIASIFPHDSPAEHGPDA
jgi:hypothetical protein